MIRVKVHRGVLRLSLIVLVVGLYLILNAPREIVWIPPSLTGLQTLEPGVEITSSSPDVSRDGTDFNLSAVLNFSSLNVKCVLFENISNMLILLFAAIFTVYIIRKYVLSKNPPLRAWR